MNAAQEIWNKTLLVMADKLTDTTIRTWFGDVTAVDMEGDTLVLCAPEDFKRDIIQQRYKRDVESALSELFSQELTIRLVDQREAERWQSGEVKKPFMAGTDEYTFD